MNTLGSMTPTPPSTQTTKPAHESPKADHATVLALLLEQSEVNKHAAITYDHIEAVMVQLGMDPFEEGDTYQQVIDGLEQCGIAVVDNVDVDVGALDADTLAEEIADDVVAQLARLIQNPDEYRHPLLTAERERRLLELYHDGQRAKRELTQADSLAQRHAAERRINAAEQALEELVRCNLRLVAQLALRSARYAQHLTLDDLIQEGKIGLCRAIEKYDLDMRLRLSTYATWWIRQSITRAYADQDRTIRLPVHVVETVQKLAKVAHRIEMILGRAPTAIEVALQCDIPTILSPRVSFQLRIAPAVLYISGQTTQEFEDRVALDRAAQRVTLHLTKAHPLNELRQNIVQAQSELLRIKCNPTAEEVALICEDERLLPLDVRMRLQLHPAALQTGSAVYIAEVDELVQKAARKVQYLQSYHILTPISLDLPIGNKEHTFLGEFVPANTPWVEDEIMAQELERLLQQELADLDEREQLVLKLRFGLELRCQEQEDVIRLASRRHLAMPQSGERWTLEEIGRLFDLTRERIRQLEVKALKRLRRRAWKYLRVFLEG